STLGSVEQRVRGAGYGAPVESHPEGAGGVIGLPGDAFGLVDVRPCLDSRTGDLEHRHVTGDPPAVPVVLRRIGGDVVADLDGAYIDPLGLQFMRRQSDMPPVAGVVAHADDHAT